MVKKIMFGVCRECFHIKKFENIEGNFKQNENCRLYTCADCVVKSVWPALEYNKSQKMLFNQ